MNKLFFLSLLMLSSNISASDKKPTAADYGVFALSAANKGLTDLVLAAYPRVDEDTREDIEDSLVGLGVKKEDIPTHISKLKGEKEIVAETERVLNKHKSLVNKAGWKKN